MCHQNPTSPTYRDVSESGRIRKRFRLTHLLLRTYQLTLSSLVGSRCRHLPTCSAYMDEAIAQHGLWAGGFMGLARLCRCHPWGTAGFDPVPDGLPPQARWWRPWTYGRWRGPLELDWTAGVARASDPKPVPGLGKKSDP